ncbi:hypothetical protein CSC81_01720 [Tenacibaculum discolor]|uniref:Bacteriocin n=2 Tax=Tenacibaculum TaxID=104267 RepID=A0A2G1BY56_9FLAO|nr:MULTISPECIES: hypothetical protein [Tenacibaculum]MDE1207240.1 hypothetical protein [Tenacibaculum larymnensis]MDP2541228.1 hypothetical protein [Tenacibaculum discolor]PHN98928.1 hypothetical protein CSC81_01720 [Tenacibaculum discolor]
MKKQILNIGKLLNKTEQKQVKGGAPRFCQCDSDCGFNSHCCSNMCFLVSAPNYPTGNCPAMECPNFPE